MIPLLAINNIAKAFAGVQALSGVSFELRPGEVHALVGENGAGKSTLIKLITGAHQPDSGTLTVQGQVVTDNDPVKSRGLGIACIYQQPALFPDLTVAENLAINLERGGPWRIINWKQRREQAQKLLQRVGAKISPDATVSQLTMPQQQLVEIAGALGADARILIMDEPTASLAEAEVANLLNVIRELRAQGVGIIYISHRLEELFGIADRVTVLRDGSHVTTCPMSEVNQAELIRLMVGRDISAVFPKQEVPLGEIVLEARQLSCAESGTENVSFQVRAGEILGLVGLVGAGRTELAKTLFGLTPADSGQILLRGQSLRITSAAQAVSYGIAYVPEDRRRHGVILDLSVSQNASLSVLKELSTCGILSSRRERDLTESYVEKLFIKTASIGTPVGNLSGGNQQKVALARWLATKPAVLILDEPTQGIDVGAKAEIHRLMGDLARQGLAIIMISSELPEMLGMSDRIAVMRGGTIVGEFSRADATQEKILHLALG
ncbi:MAG: ABC-type sugar transport system, ATPase component [Planctomycetaceae bacterium]|nr:ABC-type sugar transport system, ATPase component [Planctomycetaceae bacterium]